MPFKARRKIVPFLLVVSLIHSSNDFKLSNVGLPLRFAVKRWRVFEPVAYVRDPHCRLRMVMKTWVFQAEALISKELRLHLHRTLGERRGAQFILQSI